jgi:hypothetical protein
MNSPIDMDNASGGQKKKASNLEQNLECLWNDLGTDLERLEFWSGTPEFWLKNTWNSGIISSKIIQRGLIRFCDLVNMGLLRILVLL